MLQILRYLSVFTLLVLALVTAISQESREIRKTVPLDADGRVFVDTYKGRI